MQSPPSALPTLDGKYQLLRLCSARGASERGVRGAPHRDQSALRREGDRQRGTGQEPRDRGAVPARGDGERSHRVTVHRERARHRRRRRAAEPLPRAGASRRRGRLPRHQSARPRCSRSSRSASARRPASACRRPTRPESFTATSRLRTFFLARREPQPTSSREAARLPGIAKVKADQLLSEAASASLTRTGSMLELAALHVSRAGLRQEVHRPPDGPMVARRRALRDAHRKDPLRRGDDDRSRSSCRSAPSRRATCRRPRRG